MQRNINTEDKNSPAYLDKQYATARYALLISIIFTALNIALLLLGSQQYYLFSQSLPYYLTLIAMLMDGGTVGSVTSGALVVAVIVLGAYTLCWSLSKSRVIWLKVALALFCVDTAVLLFVSFVLLENPISNVMDAVLHVIVIYELIRGIRCAARREQGETLESLYRQC